MTPKNTEDPQDDSLGVLDDAVSADATDIGILSGTAQVSVALPIDEDDDLVDDGVVDGEVITDLVIEEPIASAVADVTPVAAKAAKTKGAIAKSMGTTSSGATSTPPKAEKPARGPAAKTAGAKTATAKPATKTAAKSASARPAAAKTAATSAAPTTGSATSTSAKPAEAPELIVIDAEAVQESAAVDRIAEERAAAELFMARAKADAQESVARAGAGVPAQSASPASLVPEAAGRPAAAAGERAPQPPRVELTSKRLDDLSEAGRESADLLTTDRLLDPQRVTRPEPEGGWSHLLYTLSGRRINIGDSRRVRERKALLARIAAPISGGARFVPVLSRKGGVGKTTITTLLGMALADAREDRVIAVDANPDRGTLADRVARQRPSKSVRDLVRIRDDVRGYHDISAIVARDATRLDVLASDADPHIAEAFADSDYRQVADLAAQYYSLVLTDTGTGIVHSVMSATLDLADQIVIVSGLSVDEARLASETLTWLESNGYAAQARDAIIVLNQASAGLPMVRLAELEAHFATRAKHVVRMPYDPQIATGGPIVFANLHPSTREAARGLAALLVEGIRARAA